MTHSSKLDVPAPISHYSNRQRALLLQIARNALANALLRQEPAAAAVTHAAAAAEVATANPSADLTPSARQALWAPRACFVTLWRRADRELRGCRGECRAHQPLALAVGYMALAAGLDDPRFSPVTGAELSALQIEISVLTPLQTIAPADVEVGRHGLLIAADQARGLLLPQVAVEHHMQREQFLDAVCSKAGLATDAWRKPAVSLWAFETETWEEDPTPAWLASDRQ
jgi:AmmeMemoRadiSam system protein A